MHPQFENIQNLTRRHFLKDIGLGSIALTTLMEPTITASPTVNPMRVKPAHTKPKAKRIIYLHMTGSPPNLDLYDYKPELVKRDGQNCPNEFLKDRRFAFTTGIPKLMGTRRQFAQYGESGLWLSDAIPNFRSIADEMCMIRSMYTDQFNHAPAELMVYTGSPRSGRPSMGSWVTYGLGSEN